MGQELAIGTLAWWRIDQFPVDVDRPALDEGYDDDGRICRCDEQPGGFDREVDPGHVVEKRTVHQQQKTALEPVDGRVERSRSEGVLTADLRLPELYRVIRGCAIFSPVGADAAVFEDSVTDRNSCRDDRD